jgi:hypothetical protein
MLCSGAKRSDAQHRLLQRTRKLRFPAAEPILSPQLSRNDRLRPNNGMLSHHHPTSEVL